MAWRLLQTVVLAVLATAQPAFADSTSPLAFTLRDLETGKRESLQQFAGAPTVMVFFEPECSWCLRQVRAINQLGETCPGQFQALGIGVNGDRQALKKALHRMRPAFPAYEASPALIDAMGGVPATPFTLLTNADGSFAGWLRGYIPQERLATEILGIEGNCPASAS